jgi:hypothetical protein
MDHDDLPLHLFTRHEEVDMALRALQRSSFDMRLLSLVGRPQAALGHPLGFYAEGEHIRSWGDHGDFWRDAWQLLSAPAVFVLPGLGLVAMAGPLVAALLAELDGAPLLGDVSALGAAWMHAGLSRRQAQSCEAALKLDRYVLMVAGADANPHGAEIAQARTILAATRNQAPAATRAPAGRAETGQGLHAVVLSNCASLR